MKTPEEIEKLAEKEYPIQLNENHYKPDVYDDLNEGERNSFIKGYTQYQKDNAEIISFFSEIWEQMNGKTDEKGDMVYIPYALSQKIRNYKSLNKKD